MISEARKTDWKNVCVHMSILQISTEEMQFPTSFECTLLRKFTNLGSNLQTRSEAVAPLILRINRRTGHCQRPLRGQRPQLTEVIPREGGRSKGEKNRKENDIRMPSTSASGAFFCLSCVSQPGCKPSIKGPAWLAALPTSELVILQLSFLSLRQELLATHFRGHWEKWKKSLSC